ncbi:hypothetical protein B0H14DRAFT_2728684 [Mycena olivaceomarginata]|nr:hypothetical protein B0H14DRAFT_2728684 [Mycena olivaceomarginata]
MSQVSIPISALVSPHAPSVARSGMGMAYHMQDPRRPARTQPTGWGLTLGDDGGRSPVHAWLFFTGFVLFPLWWVAAFGRRGDEKGKGRAQVVLDDPQVEFDARSWRRRCRIMAGVSLVTYVPFIVLLAVFLSRR